MNLLAHLHLGALAELSVEEAAGNLTADFCREKGSSAFQYGVRLHRRIDSFTDAHPQVAEARRLFAGELRRFASVICDLAFDLCLTRTWDRWHVQRREDQGRHGQDWDGHGRENFIDRHLNSIWAIRNRLPGPSAHVLQAMIAGRWLHAYDGIGGMEASIGRIVRRRPKFAPLLKAPEPTLERYADLELLFLKFYPDLIAEVEAWPPDLLDEGIEAE